MGTSSISIAYLPTQFSIGYNGINKSPTEYIFFLYIPTLVFVLATSESSLQTCLENILTPCTCDDVETCQYVEGEYVKVRLTSPAIESFHSIDKVIRVEETNRVSDRRLFLSLSSIEDSPRKLRLANYVRGSREIYSKEKFVYNLSNNFIPGRVSRQGGPGIRTKERGGGRSRARKRNDT